MADYTTGSRKLPSQRTIAFAVSIVRSKPPELSIAEYIQLLRQHIAKGRRENALSATYRHLDRSSYWHAEFERMKNALGSMEAEKVDLQREVDGLKDKLGSTKASPVKKRKRVDEDVIPVPRSPKKAKTDSAVSKKYDLFQDLTADLDLSGTGEAGDAMMRSLFQVHKILKNHDRTEPSLLAYHLVQAAEALPQLVGKRVEQDDLAGKTAIDGFKPIIVATGRCFRYLISGFDRLTHVAGGSELCGQVTYAFVQMYSKLVDLIEAISKVETSSTAVTVPTKSIPSKKAKVPAAMGVRSTPLLDLLTRLLSSMLDRLDSKAETHRPLFEGFAYTVLNKLGPKLYTIAFGHPRAQDIAEEIQAGVQTLEAEENEGASADLSDAESFKAATKLQAPYLIHLLNHIMTAAPGYLGAAINAKTGKPKAANNKGSVKGALTVVAKERLQRTLVNCMFGAEGASEEDPFKECLNMPVTSGPALLMPKLKGGDVKDWFQEEIWRLLGWEILSSERDW